MLKVFDFGGMEESHLVPSHAIVLSGARPHAGCGRYGRPCADTSSPVFPVSVPMFEGCALLIHEVGSPLSVTELLPRAHSHVPRIPAVSGTRLGFFVCVLISCQLPRPTFNSCGQSFR